MKFFFLTPLLVITVVMISGFTFPSNFVYAHNASMYAPGQQYNFVFRFRNQERMIRNQDDFRILLQDIIEYLRELQDLTQISESEVEVSTQTATNVTDDSVTLRGRVTDFNSSDYAVVGFEYGRSSVLFTDQTDIERIDDSSDGYFSQNLTNLHEDTKYYYRALARDDRGRSDYGSVMNFITKETSLQDEPDVITRSAIDVAHDSAVLRGDVEMNGFRNGRVFFVYGEDEDRVYEVDDAFDTYEEVDEYGDDLQKILVDRDLDTSSSYEEEVTSLDDNTKYYFAICVDYENDDNDEEVRCGNIRSFQTD